MSFVGTTTTVLLDTNGYDIDLDFPTYEGAWTSVSGAVSGTGYLVVEFSSNVATESIYLDNIMFYSDGLDLDLDDDNDGYLDVNDDCPFDATEHLDTDGDGFCNIQDTDDDGDGTYDWNDLYPLDPTRQQTLMETESATTPTSTTTMTEPRHIGRIPISTRQKTLTLTGTSSETTLTPTTTTMEYRMTWTYGHLMAHRALTPMETALPTS